MGEKSYKGQNVHEKMSSTDTTATAGLDDEHQVASISETYVTFYQIAKEVAEEEGHPFVSDGQISDQNAFDSYRATRRRYLIEILKKINLLEKFQPKKGEEFQIPLCDKESIKFFLRHYAEPLNKKVRQGKIDKITGKDAKRILQTFESTVLPNMPKEEGQKKRSLFSALTQAESRYALDIAMVGLKEMWENDIGDLIWRPVSKVTEETRIGKLGKPIDKELRIFNDCDAAFLIHYYYLLMLEQSRIWNDLVDIVDEIRTEEAAAILDLPSDVSENENDHDRVKNTFSNIYDVLFEARGILTERQIKRLEPKQKIPEDQLKTVEQIINQNRKDKS